MSWIKTKAAKIADLRKLVEDLKKQLTAKSSKP